MISEEDVSFNCDICGIIFAGRDESEQHLRGEHLEKYKSLFARECFLKTRHHEKYREWEAQKVYIEGLTFCNLDEMETHGRKLKEKQVQNRGANGEKDGDQTFKIVRECPSGSNIFEVEKSVRKDGNLRNTIVKEVFAKVTTRLVKRTNENVDEH